MTTDTETITPVVQLREAGSQPANLALLQGQREMSLLERAVNHALAHNGSLDQVQQLLNMKERQDEIEARKAFVEAMAQFKQNPPKIVKDKAVGFADKEGNWVGYKHATLAAVCEAAIKGLADVGISHRWDVKQEDGRITVTCVLTHRLGHSEGVPISAGADTSGKKNAIQAVASSITYLQRYTLLSATGLATEDQDDDGASHQDPTGDWAKPFADEISAAHEAKTLVPLWTTVAAACRRRQDPKAYDELKQLVQTRRDELGIDTAMWAEAGGGKAVEAKA